MSSDSARRGGLFPRTTQGLLAGLRRGAGPAGGAGLETLCRRYWKPVYGFIRAGWAKSSEDAKDLTQGFFAWLLEGDILQRYDRERASFRKFLKLQVRAFVSDRHKGERRLKRGGGAGVVPFDEGTEALESLADAGARDPDRVFDQAWLMTLMAEAIGVVRKRLEAERRPQAFGVFEAHDLADGEPPSYAELGQRFGLKESQVRDTLAAVRRKVRAAMQAQLAEQAGSARDLEEEWKALFGA
jgi:RNA polymerase sigma-70 factor (ECF subfamily)